MNFSRPKKVCPEFFLKLSVSMELFEAPLDDDVFLH